MKKFETLTIFKAWNEIKRIERKIDLIKTLSETEGGLKASRAKEILVKNGFSGNDAILLAIDKKDGYSKSLKILNDSKRAYEKYIDDEIEDLKLTDVHIAIGFLKEYKKMTWDKIAKQMEYSVAQCRRYYDEYKGKSSKYNTFLKDEQK